MAHCVKFFLIPFLKIYSKNEEEAGIPPNSSNGSKSALTRPGPSGRRTSIRQQHMLLILLIFMPLFAIEIYSALSEYQNQRQTVLYNQAATARSVGRTMTAFLNDQVSNNRALSLNFDPLRNLTTEQGNSILANFQHQKSFFHDYRYIGLNGRALFGSPASLVGFDSSREPFYQKVMDGADFAVSNLRLSDLDQKTSTFIVATPIRDSEDKLRGVMAVSINISGLGQILDINLGQRGRGSLSIHDQQGNLLYNNLIPEASFTYRTEASRRLPASVVTALSGQEALQPSVTSSIDNVEKMGASAPISLVGWSASVAEPVEDALTPTFNIIIPRVGLFLLVALIALIGAWVYSRYLTQPLLRLRETAVDFGEGNLNRRIPLEGYSDEIEQLAMSFNQMADQIAEDTRSKDVFLSQVAHELKTPITVIKGSTQLIISRQEKEVQTLLDSAPELGQPALTARRSQLKLLRSTEHQVNRMTELINRLLELSRLQTGKMEYKEEAVNFAGLLEQSVEAVRQLTTLEKHPIELTGLDDSRGWVVSGDEARLEQVVLNLLENAIKYSPEGGPIQISLRQSPPGQSLPLASLELVVKDSGLGLDPSDLSHIFERYYRARKSDDNISGLGLGLYISHEIIRQHQGRLWVTSLGLGQGSSFHLALPLK